MWTSFHYVLKRFSSPFSKDTLQLLVCKRNVIQEEQWCDDGATDAGTEVGQNTQEAVPKVSAEMIVMMPWSPDDCRQLLP